MANTKRTYPLFIIDDSRSHGRGSETDYISCTSNECPFIARVTLHQETEYKELYQADDYRSLWADPRNGIYMRLQIISDLPEKATPSQVRSLLRRALKEILLRRETKTVNINDIQDKDVCAWAEAFTEQIVENLRESNDKTQQMHLAVLTVIKERFQQSEYTE